MSSVTVRPAVSTDLDALAGLCVALWPHCTIEEEREACRPILEGRQPYLLPMTYLVAETQDGALVAFAEVSLRSHADGCDPARPVGYLEGWFVAESYRGQGLGRALVRTAEEWARAHGCSEFASDALIDNLESLHAHQALGFEVVDRCVNFRKKL